MLTIEKYNTKNETSWNTFLNKSFNGTIFSHRNFLNYHINRQFKDNSLLIYRNRELIAIIPAVVIIENDKTILHSHPGASYGGIILKNNLNFKVINNIINTVDQYCINNSFHSFFLINSPNIYHQYKDHSLEYLLSWNGYKSNEIYISHAVNVNTSDGLDTILAKRKRRYLNNDNSLQNIQFNRTNDINLFYQILIENKKRFNIKPTHSLNEITKLLKLFPDHIQLFISSINSQTIGGSVLFHTNMKASLVFYNAVLAEYRTSQLSMYQLYQCMKIVKNNNINILDFGVSHVPEAENPLSPKFSLIQFKEQLGAKGVIRKTYQKDYIFE